MTQDTSAVMRLCFPRGFIPSWGSIEESSQLLIAENLRTPFVEIHFDVIDDVKVNALERC